MSSHLDVLQDRIDAIYLKLHKFDESQPRDQSGRWTDGGGGAGSSGNGVSPVSSSVSSPKKRSLARTVGKVTAMLVGGSATVAGGATIGGALGGTAALMALTAMAVESPMGAAIAAVISAPMLTGAMGAGAVAGAVAGASILAGITAVSLGVKGTKAAYRALSRVKGRQEQSVQKQGKPSSELEDIHRQIANLSPAQLTLFNNYLLEELSDEEAAQVANEANGFADKVKQVLRGDK